MANKNQVYIDIIIDDKGTTKRVAVDAGKLGIQLDKAAKASEKGAKGTEKLSKANKNLDRNMRGTAKMSGNTTKEFSKMTQGMGGLVGAYATLAAQVFAVSAAFQFLSSASDFRNLVRGQEALGASTGTTYKTISNAIVQATDAQLKYAEAAKGAAIGVAAGLQASQLTRLAEAAKNTSFALGRDLTDSYNRLIRGVTKAEPELLDELGIILRLEPATKKYAQEIGKTAGELNAFERTQAVANEVLEQAERKFGAIGDQMDPSSTALARFQKSFDELVNSFKVGLIDVLSPVFAFLSKNTMALTAALALFAIPILKAIIPGLNDWAEKQKAVYEQHNKSSKNYKAEMQRNAKSFKVFNDAQNKGLRESQATAQKLAKERGTKGSGMNFLTGEGKGRAADADRILKGAERQTLDGKKALTGQLQGYNALEVADLRKSYDRRVALAGTATTKIKGFWASTFQLLKVGTLGVQSAWSKAMAGMVTVARGAAKAINVAMAAASLVGVIMLLFSLGTALKDFLFPLSDKMQAENDKIAEMADGYKTLNKEMALNAAARKDRLIGSEITMAEGATLQGADVGKVISDIRTFRGTSTSAEGYEDTQKDLEGVAKQLAIINPEFSVLQGFLAGTGDISIEFGQKLVQSANDAIELGNELRQLPQILKDADTAFTDLGKSLLSVTPLTGYIDKQKKALEIIEKNIKATKDASDRLIQIQADQVAADAKAAEEFSANNSALLTRLAIYDKIGESAVVFGAPFRLTSAMLKWEKGIDSPAQIKEKELLAKKQAKIDKERQDAAKKSIEDDTKELKERNLILGKAADLENLIIDNRMKQTELLKDATDKQTLGLTIQGRLQNLSMDQVKRSATLLKAEEALQTAIFSREDRTGVELQVADKKIAQARAELELVKSQNRFQEAVTEQKRQQFFFTQRTLELVNSNILAGETAGSVATETTRQKNLRGKTRATTSFLRGREATRLGQSVTDNKATELQAKGAYRDVFRREMDELYETEGGYAAGEGRHIGSHMDGSKEYYARSDKVTANLTGKPVGITYRAAQTATSDSVQAQTDFNSEAGADGNFLTNQLTMEREKLAIQTQGLVIGRGREESARLLAQYEGEFGIASEEVIARYDREGQALAEQKTILEGIDNVRQTIASSMTTAFQGLIEGTKTAKQAFADMAKSILSAIAQMIAKLLVVKILGASMFGGLFDSILPKASVKDGGIPYPMAKGGYSLNKHNYSRGGMARGAQAGYAATLHGNEAVVPLPDNRSIPVTLNGAGGQNNNVVVNVSMDGRGGSQQSSNGNSEQGKRIGQMVASAVQEELQYQKRSGGILNPYGAA
jgi:hypothetical protein